MRNLVLLIMFSTVWATATIKADLGSCVYYQAKFYLKDGTTFNGGFEFAGYAGPSYLGQENTNEFCNDEGIFRLFKDMQRQYGQRYFEEADANSGKFPIYKNFDYVTPIKRGKSNRYYNPTYGFIIKGDIVYLDSTEIEKMVFWDANYTKREWLTSEIIVGSQGMLDTIKNEKYWNSIVLDLENSKPDSLAFSSWDSMWGYELINYNPKNNEQELRRLAKLKLSFLADSRKFYDSFKAKNGLAKSEMMSDSLRRKADKALADKLQNVKDWLWKRGVVIIRINGTC